MTDYEVLLKARCSSLRSPPIQHINKFSFFPFSFIVVEALAFYVLTNKASLRRPVKDSLYRERRDAKSKIAVEKSIANEQCTLERTDGAESCRLLGTTFACVLGTELLDHMCKVKGRREFKKCLAFKLGEA